MRHILFATLLLLPFAAQAKVGVKDMVMQKGLWRDTECAADAQRVRDGEKCLCEADITYIELSGIPRSDTLNAMIQERAQRATAGMGEGNGPACQGEKLAEGAQDIAGHTQVQFAATIGFENDALLQIDFNNWGYGEGAAHGYGSVDSMIVEKKTGAILKNTDILRVDKIAQLNTYLYDTLENDERSFLSAEETATIDASGGKRGHAYVSADAAEGSFTIDSKQNTLSIVFNQYAVGPYSSGHIDIAIPSIFIAHPAIKKLYGAAHAG